MGVRVLAAFRRGDRAAAHGKVDRVCQFCGARVGGDAGLGLQHVIALAQAERLDAQLAVGQGISGVLVHRLGLIGLRVVDGEFIQVPGQKIRILDVMAELEPKLGGGADALRQGDLPAVGGKGVELAVHRHARERDGVSLRGPGGSLPGQRQENRQEKDDRQEPSPGVFPNCCHVHSISPQSKESGGDGRTISAGFHAPKARFYFTRYSQKRISTAATSARVAVA